LVSVDGLTFSLSLAAMNASTASSHVTTRATGDTLGRFGLGRCCRTGAWGTSVLLARPNTNAH
jgi:hypothetical protein